MPGVHSPEREPISAQIDRVLVVKLKKAALLRGTSYSKLIERMIREKYCNVPLDGQDYELIEQAIHKAKTTGRRISTKVLPLKVVGRSPTCS
jgi:hypothetical protein